MVVSEEPAHVVIPGLGLGPEAWLPTLSALPDGATSFVRPLPGYGAPARRGMDLHPRSLAEGVIAGIPEELRSVVVLGHSASCQIAAHIAAIVPTRVAGLVLVGPTTDPSGATWPRLAARWLATARNETPRQVPALVRQYRRTTLRAMYRSMEAARGDAIEDALGHTTAPVLVVRGRHDRLCPQSWGAAVAGRGGPGSRLVTLDAGGHMVPLTHGHLVAAVVGAFLAEPLHRNRP